MSRKEGEIEMLKKNARFIGAVAVMMVAGSVMAAGPVTTGPVGGPFNSPGARAILLDQTGLTLGTGPTCQDFETAFDVYDNWVADDFTVPAADVAWDVNFVFVPGTNTATVDPPTGNVEFYTDAAGLPGALVCASSTTNVGDTTGPITMTLDTPCNLPAGNYWMALQVNLDFGTGGQFFCGGSPDLLGAAALWQNPLDGFGSGCTTWANLATCLTSTTQSIMFLLDGDVVPVELQSLSVE